MATVLVPHPHVEEVDGWHRVKGTKIPVIRLWVWHRRGTTVEVLLKRYPQLGPARVLDALAFAYDNQEVIREQLAKEESILDSERIAASIRQGRLPF
jgi:uncharacterized protein (DUF433 family)